MDLPQVWVKWTNGELLDFQIKSCYAMTTVQYCIVTMTKTANQKFVLEANISFQNEIIPI